MRITKINYITLFIRLLFVLLLITMFVLIPFLPTDNPWVIPIMMAILLFLAFLLLRSSLLDTISIRFHESEIEVSRLLGYKSRKIKFEDILGYSDSEIELNRYPKNIPSIILYTKDNKAYELIKYNYFNFKGIREQLTRFNYLGFEPYQTGWMFRKYKFLKT